MNWNHRVIEFEGKPGPYWAIHEVFYDDDGNPSAHGEEPAVLLTDEEDWQKGLEWTLRVMKTCLGKPVLKESDFTGKDL